MPNNESKSKDSKPKESKSRQANKEEEDDCDIPADKPPGPDNPLPEFGELYRKRRLAEQNNVKTSAALCDAKQARKRRMCRADPLKPKCIPEGILLPFKPLPETAGRYLEADAPNEHAGIQFLKNVRVRQGNVEFPGWLVELTNPQLQSVVDARDILSTGKPLCELMDPLYEAISGLASGITEEEVKEILKRVPVTSRGYSFSHFMFIAGNPMYAKKKGVLQDPLLADQSECNQQDEDEEEEQQASGSKSKNKRKKDKKQVQDRLYQPPKVTKDDWPNKKDIKSGDIDESGFSLREKLFYSGLLYCEMYDTMQHIEKLYKGQTVPEPQEKLLKRQQQTGFGTSSIGTRKLGFAEWDRPLPPLPKLSPYITDFPVVGMRKKIVRPTGKMYQYRRSIAEIQPMFLSIIAPRKGKDTIKVMPDGGRVRDILGLLASQGNCLALLPDVVTIFNLSDTLLQKIEDVRPEPWFKLPKLLSGNENQWIQRQAKSLFRPHGLPPQIANIPFLITFSDGLKLREICKQVREQHWKYICEKKEEFRQAIWPMMHVDRIPCGNLRESFIYAFDTYMALSPHLPIIRTDALPW